MVNAEGWLLRVVEGCCQKATKEAMMSSGLLLCKVSKSCGLLLRDGLLSWDYSDADLQTDH